MSRVAVAAQIGEDGRVAPAENRATSRQVRWICVSGRFGPTSCLRTPLAWSADPGDPPQRCTPSHRQGQRLAWPRWGRDWDRSRSIRAIPISGRIALRNYSGSSVRTDLQTLGTRAPGGGGLRVSSRQTARARRTDSLTLGHLALHLRSTASARAPGSHRSCVTRAARGWAGRGTGTRSAGHRAV